MEEESLQGREFFSLAEFSQFFDTCCEEWKALFFVKNSTPLSKCKWSKDPPSPYVVEALKYSSLRLACKDVKACSRVEGNRTEPQVTEGCRAFMVLRMSEKKDCLVITECQLTHNHKLCPIEFAYYYKKDYLLANSCLPVRTTNKISKQFLSGQDVRRLVSYCKNRDNGVLDTLQSLDTLFTNDPGAKVKLVFLDNRVVVKTVFFLTSLMKSLCQRFPLILFFDRMMSLNEEFDLYAVLCADATGRGQGCAYCLTRKETPNLLRFVLASMLQSVPDVKFRVHCFMLGAEIEERGVVKELLPQAKVEVCRSQVERLLFSKAREMGSPEDEKIWPLFLELTSANSQNAYNRAVRCLDAILPKAFMSYFREHWHSCYEMWVRLWAFRNPEEIDCGELIRQHQQKLTMGLRPSPTVAECILDLVLMHGPTEEHEGLTEDEVATRYHAICNPEPASLIQEELGFARHGSYDIKKTEAGFSLNDGMSEFCMDRDLTSCTCTIYTSSLLPCRHLFATRLRNKEPLFDLQLLKNNMSVFS